jgi:acyl carrier protein
VARDVTEQESLDLIKEALRDASPRLAAEFDHLTHETSLSSIPIDSIARMEMVAYIEDEIERPLPAEELRKVSTLGELASVIRARVAGAE